MFARRAHAGITCRKTITIPTPTAELIIIHGESNASGRALNSQALAGEVVSRQIVQILNNTSLEFEALDVGTNNNIPESVTEHGLELGLANEADAGNIAPQPVYLVKCGHAGSQILQWMAGDAAALWEDEAVPRIDAAIADLNARGVSYRMTVWQSIGINDRFSGDYATGDDWVLDMIDFKEQFRTRYGEDIPFLVTKFYPAFSWNDNIDDLVAQDSLSRAISETGTTYQDPNLHWDYAGFKLLASRFAEAQADVWGD